MLGVVVVVTLVVVVIPVVVIADCKNEGKKKDYDHLSHIKVRITTSAAEFQINDNKKMEKNGKMEKFDFF